MKSKSIYNTIFYILPLIFTLSLIGCTSDNKEKEPVVRKIEVAKVAALSNSDMLTLTGNIIPLETVNLAFRLSGKVEKIFFQEGEIIEAQGKAAALDTKDYALALEAKQAEYNAAQLRLEKEIPSKIKQAQAQLELTQITYDRLKSLYDGKHIPKGQLDEITAKLNADKETYAQALDAQQVAQAQLLMLKAALQKAENDLADTILYSPISGVVLKKLAQEGEVVGAGYPVLVVGKTEKVCVSVGVGEQDINKLQLGQKAKVYMYNSNKVYQGTVYEISALADSGTRTFPVKILLDNEHQEFKPGMLAKVNLELNTNESILIPISSIIKKASGTEVYVYNPVNNEVSSRKISTGEIVKDTIQVISGLETGEYLVTKGQFVLSDGCPVLVEKGV